MRETVAPPKLVYLKCPVEGNSVGHVAVNAQGTVFHPAQAPIHRGTRRGSYQGRFDTDPHNRLDQLRTDSAYDPARLPVDIDPRVSVALDPSLTPGLSMVLKCRTGHRFKVATWWIIQQAQAAVNAGYDSRTIPKRMQQAR